MTLLGERHHRLPNVASVPQYSPFRYPGGKSRWYPLITRWVRHAQPSVFVEPFAGGAHAGLAVAIEGLADEVVLVELDDNVAAVWETITGGEADWLAERIAGFEMSRAAAEEAIARAGNSVRDRAFAMIVHNRVSRGGVTAPGAGWLKRGENGNGLTSRWYPDTLVARIRAIAEAAERITFVHGDGMTVLEEYVDDEGACLFIDPPYPKAGGRLYEHSEVDHAALFALAASACGSVLMTYDDSEEVKALVNEHDLDAEPLVVSTTHHRQKTELLIGGDLSWLAGLAT
jgi:DNA adenine methylase